VRVLEVWIQVVTNGVMEGISMHPVAHVWTSSRARARAVRATNKIFIRAVISSIPERSILDLRTGWLRTKLDNARVSDTVHRIAERRGAKAAVVRGMKAPNDQPVEVRTKQFLLRISSYEEDAMLAEDGESVPGTRGIEEGAGAGLDAGLLAGSLSDR
jgi:hypothetical protein